MNSGPKLLTGALSRILAPRGFVGRNRVVAAFEQYFASNGADRSSKLTKARFQVLKAHFSLNDIARFECVNGNALLVNTVPAVFWTIYHIFADPRILQLAREQANKILTITESQNVVTKTIKLGRLNEVPLISGVVQESLGHRGSGTGPRFVMEDTMLDDRYLLKKNSYVMIPNHEMHFDAGAWGPTVKDFNAHRFVKEHGQKIHPGAFRGFGGGVNLCPGKAFATTEIVALVAMLALRFDIDSSSGHWTNPEQDLSNMALAIAPPKHKVLVDITPRMLLKDTAWVFEI